VNKRVVLPSKDPEDSLDALGLELGSEPAPLSGVVALEQLSSKVAGRDGLAPRAGARAKTSEAVRLGEDDLRQLISELAHGGNALAFVLLGPTAELEPATNFAELFWKLVERRVFGAVFTYERLGRRYHDRVVSTPGGFSLVRSIS
jgi:hypothetical protein